MLLPNGPSIWPTRPTVSAVLCEHNVWHQGQKEIAPGVSVLCAVSCLPLLRCLLSESRSSSDRSGGWMLGGWGRSSASPHLDDPTSAGNMSRCLYSRKCRRALLLPLAHRVPCARIIAGVGRTGSHAMPGLDHRNCVSPSLAFPLFSPPTSQGGIGQIAKRLQCCVISL